MYTVVNIVNGYRQPKLLRNETGSARDEFTSDTSAFLAAAMAKLETIELKRKFRHDAVGSLERSPIVAARPGIDLITAADKGEHFFKNLAMSRVPIEECFGIPKLGLGLFVQWLVKLTVPPSRAVWAIRAAYPNVSSSDLLREVFERGKRKKKKKEFLSLFFLLFFLFDSFEFEKCGVESSG
jgi:hypothetical protein